MHNVEGEISKNELLDVLKKFNQLDAYMCYNTAMECLAGLILTNVLYDVRVK
jgi:hypothetical protein